MIAELQLGFCFIHGCLAELSSLQERAQGSSVPLHSLTVLIPCQANPSAQGRRGLRKHERPKPRLLPSGKTNPGHRVQCQYLSDLNFALLIQPCRAWAGMQGQECTATLRAQEARLTCQLQCRSLLGWCQAWTQLGWSLQSSCVPSSPHPDPATPTQQQTESAPTAHPEIKPHPLYQHSSQRPSDGALLTHSPQHSPWPPLAPSSCTSPGGHRRAGPAGRCSAPSAAPPKPAHNTRPYSLLTRHGTRPACRGTPRAPPDPRTCSSFNPTSLKPFLSKRRTISPTRCRWTPSGLMAMKVRSEIPERAARRHGCQVEGKEGRKGKRGQKKEKGRKKKKGVGEGEKKGGWRAGERAERREEKKGERGGGLKGKDKKGGRGGGKKGEREKKEGRRTYRYGRRWRRPPAPSRSWRRRHS